MSDPAASAAPFYNKFNSMLILKKKIIYLDSDHHIQMTLRILFNDIPDVIGLSRLDITITLYLTHNNQWDHGMIPAGTFF